MPDPTNFTNPLGGHEIVNDVLSQIRKRLATDCNLRATDGYSGGYSGKVTIKLNLHAVRTTTVDMEVPIFTSPGLNAPEPSEFSPDDLIPMEISEEISIPIEPNLAAVRERTKDTNDELESVPETKQEESEGDSAPEGTRGKRKYTRRAALASAIEG